MVEKIVGEKKIYQGKILTVYENEVELPNHKLAKRELVFHNGATAILPFTREGKICLVKQFRIAVGEELYEIPAGKLEPGEIPEECAKRELEEETGYRCDQLAFLTSMYTSPGFSNEIIHLYLAENLEKGQAHLDEDEFLDVCEFTPVEVSNMVMTGKIKDAKTISALALVHMKR